MDGYISDCDMALETWSAHHRLLVDDASWDDSGIPNLFSHELDFGKVWNKRAACNVMTVMNVIIKVIHINQGIRRIHFLLGSSGNGHEYIQCHVVFFLF